MPTLYPSSSTKKTNYNTSDPLHIASTFSSLSEGTAGKSLFGKKGGFLAEAARRTAGKETTKTLKSSTKTSNKSLHSGSSASQHTGHLSKTDFFHKAKNRLQQVPQGHPQRPHSNSNSSIHTPPPSSSYYQEMGEEKKQELSPPTYNTDPAMVNYAQPTKPKWLDNIPSNNHLAPSLGPSDSDSSVYVEEADGAPNNNNNTSETPPTDDSSTTSSTASPLKVFCSPDTKQEASSQMQFYRDKLAVFFQDSDDIESSEDSYTETNTDEEQEQKEDSETDEVTQQQQQPQEKPMMDSSTHSLPNADLEVPEQDPDDAPPSPPPSPNPTRKSRLRAASSTAVPSHSTLNLIVGDKPVPERNAPGVKASRSKFKNSTVAVPSKSTLDSLALSDIQAEQEQKGNSNNHSDPAPMEPLPETVNDEENHNNDSDDDSNESYDPNNNNNNNNNMTDKDVSQTSTPSNGNDNSNDNVQRNMQTSTNSLQQSISSREDRYSKMEKAAAESKQKQPQNLNNDKDKNSDSDSDDDSYDPMAIEAGKSSHTNSPRNMTVDTTNKEAMRENNKEEYDSDLDSYDPENPNKDIQHNADGTINIRNNTGNPSKPKEVHYDEPSSHNRDRAATRRSLMCRIVLVFLLLTGLVCVGVGLYMYFGFPSDSEQNQTEASTTAAPVFSFVPEQPESPTMAPTMMPNTPTGGTNSSTIQSIPATTIPTIAPSTSVPEYWAQPPAAVEMESLTSAETELPTWDPTLQMTREPLTNLSSIAETTLAPSTDTQTTETPTTETLTLEPTTVEPTSTPSLLPSTESPTTLEPTIAPTEDAEAPTPTVAPVASPPTAEEPVIFEGLSDETWQAIRTDPSSPQAQAYRWILEDPDLQSYPSWQREQRFGLATNYFSWFTSESQEAVLAAEANPPGPPGGSAQFVKPRPAPPSSPRGGKGKGSKRDDRPYIYLPGSRRALRGSRKLHDGPLAHWLDYSASECNWYYKAEDNTDGNSNTDALTVPMSSRNGADDSPCNEDGVYERLSPPRSEGAVPETMADVYMVQMPAEISLLTDLKEIRMPNNQYPTTLEAFLPETLMGLTDLQKLNLSQSSISEWTPQALLRLPRELQVLDLSYNQMGGELYMELGLLMTSLEELYLDGNSLQGGIPIAIPSWTRLRNFHASSNRLSGSLPSEIGWLSSHLQVLSLSSNRMDGNLPTQVGDLTLLNTFDLDANRLDGTIPSEIGFMTSLVYFGLADNELEGSLPTEVGYLSLLNSIRLSNNRLTGIIPSEVGLLSALTNFQLHGNALEGSLPSELGVLSDTLYSIDLHDNALTGTIFTEIGALTSTNFLYLYENSLTGTIPTELGMLENASYIGLENNQLSGPIPSQFGNLEELRYLHLSNNGLTSTIPTQLGRLVWLKYLFLGENDLSGEIPSELGLISGLRYLDVGGGNSELRGTVPEEICALTQLTIRVRCSRIECDCDCQCA